MAKKEKVEALVPVEEQPYPVPENWRWVYLVGLADVIMGQSPEGSATTDDSNYIPLIGGAADMGDEYPKATRYTKVPTKLSTENDIIVCIRATLGRPIYSDGEYCLGRGVAAIRPQVGTRVFFKWLLVNFEQYLYDNATGSTFAQVSSDTLRRMPVPCPPLTEQQRIVDRIESLFAKLDEAKEKAQAVVDGFEDRKAAILHKAFTGELTETWRKKNKVEISTWKEKRIDEISTVISGYAFDRNDFSSENTVPCIKITNVGVGEYIDGYEYLPENYLLEYHRFETQKGDVLIALTRSYIAAGLKVCINMCAQRALLNQRVALIRDCNTEYLYYYLKSDSVLQYVKEKSKITNQPNLSIKDLCGLTIPYAGAEEQKVIVHELDQLIGKQKKAIKAAHCVIKQIDELKKSILAKAFRGEFGTNDPADPPVELPQ